MPIEYGPRTENQPPAMDGPGGSGGGGSDDIDLSKEHLPPVPTDTDARSNSAEIDLSNERVAGEEFRSEYLEQTRQESGEADQQPLGDHRGTLDEGAAARATAESGTPSDNLEIDSDSGGESDAAASTATVETRGGS